MGVGGCFQFEISEVYSVVYKEPVGGGGVR